MDYPTRLIDPSLFTPTLYRTREAMGEGNSDYCISEFFGRTEYNKTGKTCNITQSCWILMTSPGYSMYSLTHEVFYLEIGEKFGCRREIQKWIDHYQQKSIDDLNAGFCANVFHEAQELSWHKYYWTKQDLFMEQAALCGILGFQDFFKADWLKKIISWQSKNGCFKDKVPHDYPKDVWKKNKREQGRYKREEKKLPDGCLSHKTGVAVAALANYLRYIPEDMDREKITV